MTIAAWPPKDPDANLRYYFDWSAFVAAEESAIAGYALAIDGPPDAALLLGVHALSSNVVMVWISGGTLEQTYTVRCRATLTNGTIEDESRTLKIVSK